MHWTLRAAAAVVALASVAPASAVVLDFDNYRPTGPGTDNLSRTYVYGPVIEDGFKVTPPVVDTASPGQTCYPAGQGHAEANCFTTAQIYRSIDPTGAALQTVFEGTSILITNVDGLAFNFNSIDIGSNYSNASLNFIFNFADGTSKSIAQLLPAATSPRRTGVTYSFDEAAVLSIELDPTAGHFQFDNINVTAAVPEPATWAMMIGGFGLVGGAMRRRNGKLALA